MVEATGGPGGEEIVSTGDAQPGWYAAQGDPPGTLRYWDGAQWVGTPVVSSEVGEPEIERPAVEWSTQVLGQTGARTAARTGARSRTEYANWGRRVAAWFIDVAILLPFFIGAVFVFSTADTADVADPTGTPSSLWLVGALLFLAALVVSFANSIIMHGVTGRTVGKRVVGTKLVLGDTNDPPGIWRVVARGLLSVIASNITIGIYALIDSLFPLWDARKQRISDKVVNTFVIRV